MSESMKCTCFRLGLKETLCDKLSTHKFITLNELIEKAVQIETAKSAGQSFSSGGISSNGSSVANQEQSGNGQNFEARNTTEQLPSQRQYDKQNLRCFACQGYGHYARKCKAKMS
jgi:hypothetical protein